MLPLCERCLRDSGSSQLTGEEATVSDSSCDHRFCWLNQLWGQTGVCHRAAWLPPPCPGWLSDRARCPRRYWETRSRRTDQPGARGPWGQEHPGAAGSKPPACSSSAAVGDGSLAATRRRDPRAGRAARPGSTGHTAIAFPFALRYRWAARGGPSHAGSTLAEMKPHGHPERSSTMYSP